MALNCTGTLKNFMHGHLMHCFQARSTRTLVSLLFGLLLLSFSGCSEYWWQRGQPPSVSQLLARSSSNFSSAQSNYGSQRGDVSPTFKEINEALDRLTALATKQAPANLSSGDFGVLISKFIQLEGKLSIGSRAAYGELSGQLRAFAQDASTNNSIPYPAFGLFAVRTKNFLASELSVPSPVS